MHGFTFNGTRKDYVVTLRGKKRPPWAPLQRNLIEVPGMPGGHPGSTDVKARKLSIPILIESKNFTELKSMSEDLAGWLVTDEPVELIFDDEPNRTYFAYVDETLDIDEIIRVGAGILTFICPDPYKYGKEQTAVFKDSGAIVNGGTAETYPITKIVVNKDTTFVSIGNGDKINMVGSQAEVTQKPYVREERMFWHECNTLVGWTGTTTLDGSTNKGVLKTNGYLFHTSDYGADTAYHGPAMKTSLSTTIQDFQVDTLINLKGDSGQAGSIDICLLDVNNKIVGKLSMEKRSPWSAMNWARITAGSITGSGYDIIHYGGHADWVWSNFSGMLRIGRTGKTWYAYVCRIINGKQDYGYYKEWTDVDSKYSTPIAQVQVQVSQYGTIPVAHSLQIEDIKVFRINSPTNNEIPYIARANDIIEFDHQNDVIRRNGEVLNKEKAFIGEYFPLKKGANAIVAEPANSIESTEVRWRERWL